MPAPARNIAIFRALSSIAGDVEHYLGIAQAKPNPVNVLTLWRFELWRRARNHEASGLIAGIDGLVTQGRVMMRARSNVKVRTMVAPSSPTGSLRRTWKRSVTAGLATGLAVVSLCGCAASEPIYLKSANGKIVRCGPYLDFGYLPAGSKSTEAKVWDCVSSYERNGYERVQRR